MFTEEDARNLLVSAQVFYEPDDDEPQMKQVLNLNDACFWGCADAEKVSDAELPRVAELFWRYGFGGILFWVVVEKRGMEKVEFVDVNRQIEFVRHEESIRREEPSSSKRAYLKRQYTVGAC